MLLTIEPMVIWFVLFLSNIWLSCCLNLIYLLLIRLWYMPRCSD